MSTGLSIRITDDLEDVLDPSDTARAEQMLREYFTPMPAGRFTGAHFERFAGGGDRPEVRDEFTAEDLVAVSMLAVEVPGKAALDVLVHRRDALSANLARISTATAFADLAADDLGPGSAIRELYEELVTIPDIGTTTATKLMARKRPHVVPILDSVITAELGIVRGEYWRPLHAWLTADGHARYEHLVTLREQSQIGDDISVLRVFDVLAWGVGKGYIPDAGATARV